MGRCMSLGSVLNSRKVTNTVHCSFCRRRIAQVRSKSHPVITWRRTALCSSNPVVTGATLPLSYECSLSRSLTEQANVPANMENVLLKMKNNMPWSGPRDPAMMGRRSLVASGLVLKRKARFTSSPVSSRVLLALFCLFCLLCLQPVANICGGQGKTTIQSPHTMCLNIYKLYTKLIHY